MLTFIAIDLKPYNLMMIVMITQMILCSGETTADTTDG